MVRFSFKIKTCCLYVTWEIQDQIWANIFCIPKIMHSRAPMSECLCHLRAQYPVQFPDICSG